MSGLSRIPMPPYGTEPHVGARLVDPEGRVWTHTRTTGLLTWRDPDDVWTSWARLRRLVGLVLLVETDEIDGQEPLPLFEETG